MKKFIKFWQRDIINKLIVLLVLVLVLGAAGLAFIIVKMPTGRSIQAVLGDFFPTPTQSPKVVMTKAALKAATQNALATLNVPPTPTTMPFKPVVTLPSPTDTAVPATSQFILPATEPVAVVSTATPSPGLVNSATPAQGKPTPTQNAGLPGTTATPLAAGQQVSAKCIPANPVQKGKVLDILDGYTVKVLIDGYAYIVRYIGVAPSDNKNFAMAAAVANGGLVFAQDITLVADTEDKDASGRLLRYVSVGDTFVNLQLVLKGQLQTIDSTPNSACASEFAAAQQSAKSAGLGMWIPVPTP